MQFAGKDGSRAVHTGSNVGAELTIRCKSLGNVVHFSTKEGTDFNELAWVVGDGDLPFAMKEGMIGMKLNAARKIEVPSRLVFTTRNAEQLPEPKNDESDDANANKNRVIALQDMKDMGFLEKERIRDYSRRKSRASLNFVTVLDYRKCLISFVAVILMHYSLVSGKISPLSLTLNGELKKAPSGMSRKWLCTSRLDSLLRHNPSVLDEESRYLLSQKKRKRLNFVSDNYEESLSGMALKLVVQCLRPDDVLSCVQTCKEWNASIDDNIWAGIARRINPTSCQAIENVGMGNLSYKNMVMAFVRKELPLWKVPEMPKSLKAEDVIIVVEIRQGSENSERNLLGSYSCLLSNLHGAKNMKLQFRNCSETGAHFVIPTDD
ncbi:hypothetical protein CTEN210_13934 [Chaetoceros tenuissimus]|uniref:Uncharacterized protein n=1 Tax=Chaetoceros tenuissimus TaxID=426638 RepID=A0AAD3D475_9STRA|nr:hypothetical protein CTEN210_13934 [Chaetoceros tenuissimus]